MTSLRLTFAVAVAAIALAGSASLAAGPEEVFVDTARAGKLTVADLAVLDGLLPVCPMWAPKTQVVFCVDRWLEDDVHYWDAVFVTAKKTERVRLASGRGDLDPPAERGAFATLNARLKRSKWREDIYADETLTQQNGTPVTGKLEDGRLVKIDGPNVSVEDTTTTLPITGKRRGEVSFYPVGPDVLVTRWLGLGEPGALDKPKIDVRWLTDAKTKAPGPTADCPASVTCPPNYTTLKPLLGHFCADTFDAGIVAETKALAASKALVAEDLSVLFNAFGAMHGYRFKTLAHYNRFFYGADDLPPKWLPPACLSAIDPAKKSAAHLTKTQRKARSAVKKLWRAQKK